MHSMGHVSEDGYTSKWGGGYGSCGGLEGTVEGEGVRWCSHIDLYIDCSLADDAE